MIDSLKSQLPLLATLVLMLPINLCAESPVDSDGDGMPDWYEQENGLNPQQDDSTDDIDGDGLSNLEEYNLNTWANRFDSDEDQVMDGDDAFPTDPNKS